MTVKATCESDNKRLGFNVGDLVYADNPDGTITVFGVMGVREGHEKCTLVTLYEPRENAPRKVMSIHYEVNFFQLKKFYGRITLEST